MAPIVNIAAYKFVALGNLQERRKELLWRGEDLQLQGTILLSTEGINCFLAGTREAIDSFLNELQTKVEFADLEVKESFSDRQPFSRLLVRIKKEIIAFGVDGIEPAKHTSPRVAPRELKRWLDDGEDVTLIDTRNDYEYALGTFANAVKLDLQDFRHFPEVVAELPTEMRLQKVVTFCTGGIRCEKAAPFMERAGFENIYQLDGGILKYFEECGGEHYDGDCFVFDHRVALDPNLAETETTLCFACQATLTKEECRSELYVPGQQCPHCHRTPKEKSAALCESRQSKLKGLIVPLPGSQPYENRRPMSVPERLDRSRAIDFLDAMKTIHSREEWREFCQSGRVQMNGNEVIPDQELRAGMRLELVTPATTEPDVNADIEFLFEDEHIVVLNKPAPLPMHPCGRFNRNSLQYLLEQIFTDRKVRPAHRLDANTSGIVVCSKTRAVARELQPQFAEGKVRKTYLAQVHGHPEADEFELRAPISREPNATGARVVDPKGLPAHTQFEVLKRFSETSLLRVTPFTGRTNQIRVHLWDAGHGIVGDPLYLWDSSLGHQQTLPTEAAPMCLHAAELQFHHPIDGELQHFTSEPMWLPKKETA
ncbi:MAG: sulfurtransferase [Limisphaerales bacterium]